MAAESADVAADNANRKGQPQLQQPRRRLQPTTETEGMESSEQLAAPEPMDKEAVQTDLANLAVQPAVAHKGLPFLYLPDLEAVWKRTKQINKFVYDIGETQEMGPITDVTGYTIKVYDSTDRDSFDVEEQTWATIIEAVDKDYLISESSQDLSKRTAVDMPTVPPLLKKIMHNQVLPAFAVSTFSYADTATGATTTKLCFVKPYSESMAPTVVPSPPMALPPNHGLVVLPYYATVIVSLVWLHKIKIPGVIMDLASLKSPSYLREPHSNSGVNAVLLDDWRMQQFP
eukprot:GHVS01027546.1.p1 GENE.GHVS01027546.1~~GHVS01027546.1.p1  ORF type:complete len:298 (-),score=40.29 GHVS01027546.1:146-1006(-)